MVIATEMRLDNAVAHIAKGVGNELERRIKVALMPHAEKVVDEVAKALCQDLKANMTNYYDRLDGDVKIALVIDGERHEF